LEWEELPWRLPQLQVGSSSKGILRKGRGFYYEFRPEDFTEGECLSMRTCFSKGGGSLLCEESLGGSPWTMQGSRVARGEDREVAEGPIAKELCPCCLGSGFVSDFTEVGLPGQDYIPQELGDIWEGRGGQEHACPEIDTYGSFLHSLGPIEGLQSDDSWRDYLRRYELQDFEHSATDSAGGCGIPEGNSLQVLQPDYSGWDFEDFYYEQAAESFPEVNEGTSEQENRLLGNGKL